MKKLSKKYDVETYQNENQIYNDKSISLVCICSYDNYHYDQIVKCIKSKKHIFVEKPAVDNLKSAKKFLSLLKRNKSIYFSSNYILQKYPKFLYLKSLIHNNRLVKSIILRVTIIMEDWKNLQKVGEVKYPFIQLLMVVVAI